MEPQGSLRHSQVSANYPCAEPARSSPYPRIPLPENSFSYFPSNYASVFQLVSFPQVSPPNPVCTSPLPIRATCPAHLILLDFITRTIFGERYKSLSSSLCSFLHSHATSSLLSPNILNSYLFSNTLSLRSSPM